MEDKIWRCITRRLNGTETVDSRIMLDDWLSSDASHVQVYQEAKMLWELSGLIPSRVSNRAVPQEPKKRLSFMKYAIAASIAGLLICAGLYFFNAGVKAEEVVWIVKKTKPAELIKLTLPDGSLVWLNSSSEIKFPKNFVKPSERIVQLKGEAFFDVTPDKNRPFKIYSDSLITTVYGTSFNIRAYESEKESSVAVSSGKVGVQSRFISYSVMLLPSDKVTLKSGKLNKSKVDNKDVNSWINGELIFEQTPMPEVLNVLARRYNVTIQGEQNNYRDCKLTARFKNKSLSAILITLHLSMNIKSKQIGQTIYLEGGNCM